MKDYVFDVRISHRREPARVHIGIRDADTNELLLEIEPSLEFATTLRNQLTGAMNSHYGYAKRQGVIARNQPLIDKTANGAVAPDEIISPDGRRMKWRREDAET